MAKTVTVFGSSLPKAGDEEYETAYKLGRLLGQNNLNVCTGGFHGIMDAVSKGAVESGTEAIGVTVNIFNSIPSQFLTKIIKCDNLFERLSNLINLGDGFIFLRGGTGTLLELSLIWEYFNKGIFPLKPAAAHGTMWKNIIDEMEKRIAYEKRKQNLIKTFDNINNCAGYIINSL